jgi:tetratricopeptide (TPR) repeat protein
VACSSPAQKSFLNTELEKRADQYLLLGDRFRLQGRSPEAIQYYRSAQLIYFKKWQPEKYLLAGMKEAALLILMGELPKAKAIMDKMQQVRNFTQNSQADADIALTQAMFLQAENNTDAAIALLDDWGQRESVPLEKRQYMRFYRLWKSGKLPPSMSEDDFESELRSIVQKYYGGELQNPEIAYFASLAAAEYYERKEQLDKSWDTVMQTIEIHRHSEVVSQWPRIFLLCSRVAEKLGKTEQASFYKKLYQEQLTTPAP